MSEDRVAAIVVTLNTARGFGFVRLIEGDRRDHFFHRAEMTQGLFEQLEVGDKVICCRAEAAKGPRAYDLVKQ